MNRFLFYAIGCVALLTGCMDFNDATEAISVTVQVSRPEQYPYADLSGHAVTLKGATTITAMTDEEGKVVFENIIPDVYNLSTSWKVTSEEYADKTGTPAGKNDFTIAGTLSSLLLSAEPAEPVALATAISQDQSLLISKVYYQGGKYTKDEKSINYVFAKYVELYNNTGETLDVTDTYLALMESKVPTSDYPLAYLTDTVVAKQVFSIPAQQLLPGKSILLVNSAIDHSMETGTQPNLLDADYEAKDIVTKPYHTNNPDVKPLELVFSYTTISMLNLTQGGPCSLVIFKTDKDVRHDWLAKHLTYAYGKKSGTQFMKIPASDIVDAVDILKYNGETGVDISTKRLFDYLDAGYTFTNSKTGYDSKAVVRRTLYRTDDGRTVLQDTNNSSNDFEETDQLNPREYQ